MASPDPKGARVKGTDLAKSSPFFFFFKCKKGRKKNHSSACTFPSLPPRSHSCQRGRSGQGCSRARRGALRVGCWGKAGRMQGGCWGAAGEGAGTLRAGGSSDPEPPQQLRKAPFKAQRRAAALAGQQSEDRLRSNSFSSFFFFFFPEHETSEKQVSPRNAISMILISKIGNNFNNQKQKPV